MSDLEELQTIKIRSLLFWAQTLLDKPASSIAKQCWEKRDHKGYMLFHENVCPICNNGHLIETSNNGQALELKGIQIGTVYCVCSSLNILSDRTRAKYESNAEFYTWSLKKPTTPATLGRTVYPVALPNQAAYDRTAKIIKAFSSFVNNPTRWGFLIGKPGSGKSSLLQAIKHKLGGFAYYMNFADFRSTMMRWKDIDVSEYESILVSAPILLVDDWGIGKETDFSTNMLATVIERRYVHKRLAPIIMTSNMTEAEVTATPDGTITNKERVLSRFLDSEIASLLISSQNDMRRKDNKEKANG